MHIVLELRWCGCCRRSGKRPLQVTLHSLHGRIYEQPDVRLSPLPTTAHRRLRQWSSVWAQDRAARRISSEGPLPSLPLLYVSVDTAHAVYTSHTKDVCHMGLTLRGHLTLRAHRAQHVRLIFCLYRPHHAHIIHLYIPHRGRVTYTVHASYPMPTSHLLHVILNVYTSHSMYSSHTCIPYTLCTNLTNTLVSHILIF